MANEQRAVVITAIVLAIIIGGSLVWLLNRTPADQVATQTPLSGEAPVVETGENEGGLFGRLFDTQQDEEAAATPTPPLFGNPNLSDEEELRQAQLQEEQALAQNENVVSPVFDDSIGKVAPAQDVAPTAPTGPQPR